MTKRLKPLRKRNGNVYGSKLLVAQDVGTGLAVAIEAAADGEAADNPLVPGLVAQLRSASHTRPRVWLADRAFGEFAALHRFAAGPDPFLVRHRARCQFYRDPAVPPRTGTGDDGRAVREAWGWLGTPGTPTGWRSGGSPWTGGGGPGGVGHPPAGR